MNNTTKTANPSERATAVFFIAVSCFGLLTLLPALYITFWMILGIAMGAGAGGDSPSALAFTFFSCAGALASIFAGLPLLRGYWRTARGVSHERLWRTTTAYNGLLAAVLPLAMYSLGRAEVLGPFILALWFISLSCLAAFTERRLKNTSVPRDQTPLS